MGVRAVLLLALLGACGSDPAAAPPRLTEDAVVLDVPEGLSRVVVEDAEGVPVASRRLPAPVEELVLPIPADVVGTLTVRTTTADGVEATHRLEREAPASPVRLELEAPVGQRRVAVDDGAELELALVDGAAVQVGIVLTARTATTVRWSLGSRSGERALRSGERLVELVTVSSEDTLVIEADDTQTRVRLTPRTQSLDEARANVELTQVVLPALPTGATDIALPAGRVTLPAPWWRELLGRLGLGTRARDGWTAWSWQALTLRNHGDQDVNLVIQATVHETDGSISEAFVPTMRDGRDEGGRVRALLRVPAGQEATASLPFFVDEAALAAVDVGERTWERRLEITPLGSEQALYVETRPLYVSRGSTALSLGLLAALLSAALGSALLVRRGPRWLREAATSELMTISLFGAMMFLLGAVGQLLTLSVAALLGPFATLLTGLLDDAFRYALFATLITLLPRPGTAALAVVTSWLLSGFGLGNFSPVDVLFVGSRVFWMEAALWLGGITRGRAWLTQGPWARWLRLTLAFGGASVLANATALILHMTLYRLFYADWYIALLLGGPGFLYVALACAVAVPFADSLRRVQR